MKTIRIEAGGIEWRVMEQAGAKRPTILLLHGFSQSAASWNGIARKLDGFRLLIPDLPGHGETEPPIPPESWRLERLADALTELCDRARAPKISLVGYSMGGRAALHMAVRAGARIKHLVLVGASPGMVSVEHRQQRSEADADLARSIEEDGIEAFVDHWEALPLFASQRELPEAIREEIRQIRLANRPAALAAALRAFGPGDQTDLWEQLPTLKIPTLLVVGEYDKKYRATAEEMGKRWPDATIETVPGAGHAVPLEAPVPFASVLKDFLSRPRRRARPAGGNEKE